MTNKPLRVGFTTSIPIEAILAAGAIPVDLNNIFVEQNPVQAVNWAEQQGFAANICAWIKGMYTVAIQADIDVLVGVVQGDCSNTHGLMELLERKGVKVIPFSYPWQGHDALFMRQQIEQLCAQLGTTYQAAQNVCQQLQPVRQKLQLLDELTWKHNKVTGLENHLWLVNSSDFKGDPVAFEQELDVFLEQAQKRQPVNPHWRLAYIGVPPIVNNLYDVVQDLGAEIIYNEVQRQFAQPANVADIGELYAAFTYPLRLKDRFADIKPQLDKRKIDGVISYHQAFCHRQIEQITIKKELNLPVLMLEGDAPGPLDARTRLRLESFIDMLELAK